MTYGNVQMQNAVGKVQEGRLSIMVHPDNACAGGYGRCLDVKITNACNANGAFCIKANGYSPYRLGRMSLTKR